MLPMDVNGAGGWYLFRPPSEKKKKLIIIFLQANVLDIDSEKGTVLVTFDKK